MAYFSSALVPLDLWFQLFPTIHTLLANLISDQALTLFALGGCSNSETIKTLNLFESTPFLFGEEGLSIASGCERGRVG